MLAKLLTHNGTWTITNNETGTRRTFRVKTVCKGNLEGKRIISLLRGQDNETAYTGFGFVLEDRIAVWRKYDGTQYWELARFLEKADRLEEQGLITVHHSGNCRVCNRKLTVPESIESGIGPVCAGKGGY